MNWFARPFFGPPSSRGERSVRIAHHTADGRDVDFTEAFRAFVAEVEGVPDLHRWEDDGGRVSA